MFTTVSSRSANAYRHVGIETSIGSANPHQLIVLLFDALLQSIASARAALARGDVATKGKEITKAVRILEEGLRGSLDKTETSGLAENLNAVYSYSVMRLTAANFKNSDAMLAEVHDLIVQISEAWRQVNHAEAAPAVTPASKRA